MHETKVKEKRYFKETIFGSTKYFASNPFLDNSIAWRIGFQLKNGIIRGGKLLIENLEVTISFYNDTAISVELPNQITCKIKNTDVALKGQTVSSSYKPATLENGFNIQVPPFIESGDKILIDTRTIEYLKKV